MKRTPRIKPALLIASAAAATVLVGSIGGATMALWHDDESFTSQIQTGKVAFAVGAPGATLAKSATASGQTLNFTFGKAEAATLLSSKAVAIPIQVDSLSQGNKGMRYSVASPTFGPDSLFGAAKTELVRVDTAADCKLAPRPQLPSPLPSGYYTRTPVSSDYSAATTPTSEFWCLTATLDKLPGAGTYTNKATVTATPDKGTGTVTASDQWWANVTSVADASKEPDHTIGFTFETFRPGK
ncbi:SipW-dependent-type signal peptide-containing protein [Paeniglutamicibacter sp. NPDC091659]|uniref:SipW-dependent-type signal peptide-containing protein n=1 Tax=Paeniglutamicibacter sp. NPDC091659 TaxID=3364389 RepID=UPI00382BF655